MKGTGSPLTFLSMWSQKDTTSRDSSKDWWRKKVRIPKIYYLDATPNIDFFTREELQEIVKKFKEESNAGDLDDSVSSDSGLDNSTGRMFDVAMNRRRSMSMIRRSMTKIAEDTVLSRTKGATCVISALNQFITS